jgi:plasmid stabilization system protein ParE
LRLALRVVTDAEQQIREASDWWHENRPAARGLFRRELRRGFDLITTHPGIGVKAFDLPVRGVRRLHLYRIHYFLYYRVLGEEAVEVLALWHTSRGQGPPL